MRSIEGKLLYHGSPYNFNYINLRAGRVTKDFGQGFYMSTSKKHAISAGRHNRGYNGGGVYLYKFILPQGASNLLNIKVFESPNIEWVNFVINNRCGVSYSNTFDIVCGPTADAKIAEIIENYTNGTYSRRYGVYADKHLIDDLMPYNYPHQVCIITERAKSILQFIGVERIR